MIAEEQNTFQPDFDAYLAHLPPKPEPRTEVRVWEEALQLALLPLTFSLSAARPPAEPSLHADRDGAAGARRAAGADGHAPVGAARGWSVVARRPC